MKKLSIFSLQNIKLIKGGLFKTSGHAFKTEKSAEEVVELWMHTDSDSPALSYFLLEGNINTNYQVSYDPSARHN